MTEDANRMTETRAPCRCGTLDQAATDPSVPVEFDDEVNEFHLVHGQGGRSVIRYCFFCGGAAPPSRRGDLFAFMDPVELDRLKKLTAGVKSIGEAIAAWGPPTADQPQGHGMHIPGDEGQPPVYRYFRSLTFTKLSKTVDVLLIDFGPQGIGFGFSGKRLGP